MKKRLRTSITVSLFIIATLFLQNCGLSYVTWEVYDVVYDTKRISLQYNGWDVNKGSPLNSMEQTIVKEIPKNGIAVYNVYDILTLNTNSFKLEEKVFLIADDKVYPIIIERMEYNNVNELVEHKTNILKADSTKVSVVTGVSEDKSKVCRFYYKLTDAMVMGIKNCSQLEFRYYSGPNMISIKPKGKKLEKIKEIINKRS